MSAPVYPHTPEEQYVARVFARMLLAIERVTPRRLLIADQPDFLVEAEDRLMRETFRFEAGELDREQLYEACRVYMGVWRQYVLEDERGRPL